MVLGTVLRIVIDYSGLKVTGRSLFFPAFMKSGLSPFILRNIVDIKFGHSDLLLLKKNV